MALNGYELSRRWFDFSFENPELINPNHGAIYFFAVEHNNRLGWRSKFGFPSQMAMDAIGIKKHSTYIRYFNDLVEWGFFKLVQKSKNQYSANIISLQNAMPKNGKALDKAIVNHAAKQTESMGQSKRSIIKPLTKELLTKEQETMWLEFWNLYDKKKGTAKCKEKFLRLNTEDLTLIKKHLPHYVKATPEKKFRKDPLTYLNQRIYLDDPKELKPENQTKNAQTVPNY